MKLRNTALAFATFMFAIAPMASAHAQTIPYAGTAQACFGSSCTNYASSATDATWYNYLQFNASPFSGTATSGVSSQFQYGSLTLDPSGWGATLLQPFRVMVSLSQPTGQNPVGNVFNSYIDGAFAWNNGIYNVWFTNPNQTFAYDGGYGTLHMEGLTVDQSGTYGLKGDITMTTTPEPSSMALLGTGLIGLVPMFRRKRNKAQQPAMV